MALKMPAPAALAPRKIFDKIRGTRLTLPIAGTEVTVTAGDKVTASLRTRDAREAKARFKPAMAALEAQFKAVRAGPSPLTRKQLVALAGEAYRRMVANGEDNPIDFGAAEEEYQRMVQSWLAEDDASDLCEAPGEAPRPSEPLAPLSLEDAVFLSNGIQK